MEHLALEVFDREGTGSKFTVLPENTSITIRRTSQLFGSGALWTYDFRLNVAANAHIFGTAGEIHGSRLHEQIDKRKARLWADGVPMYLGYLRLGDEAEVDNGGNVSVIFEGGQKTFTDMIEGAKANQVPLMSDVMIGLALWRKRKTTVTCKLEASFVFDYQNMADKTPVASSPSEVFYQTSPHTGTIGRDVPFTADGEMELQAVQEYPRMVFPRLDDGDFDDLTGEGLTTVDCINTDSGYAEDEDGTPQHPYCNVALCYQKQGYEKTQKDGSVQTDYSGEPEAQRGYEYMPANRLNSAPNFYVIYWLRCLMKHLGIHIDENQMMGVEDLRRLFFVNTNCAYQEPETLRTASADVISRYGKYQFHMGGSNGREVQRLVPEYFGKQEDGRYNRVENVNREESGFVSTDYRLDKGALPSAFPDIKHIKLDVVDVEPWSNTDREQYERDNSYLHRAYATPECFPDAEISETIKALENGFGIRLLFSDDYKRVRIVLLRNIFRSTAVQRINCEIVKPEEKVENCIRGFRMTYGDKDDTHFHYKGFDDLLPHKQELWQDNSDTHDYSKWKLDASYADIIKRVNAFDKTCYVTPDTGNAYGIKIDKDAKRYDELHPSLFGYGEYMDAEDGDCTGEEETIETIEMGFMPAIMNDLNMDQERNGDAEQRFALFVDETMRPRRPSLKGDGTDYDDPGTAYPIYGVGGLYEDSESAVAYRMKAGDGIVKPGEFAVRSDMFARMDGYQLRSEINIAISKPWIQATVPVTMNIDGHINEGYRLYLQDNYTPNDNGVSPVETHDWGLTLGIMRGSGDDAYVRYEGDPDDGEGNDTWNLVAGSSVTAHPDTCDNYGHEWDYNGKQEGIGPEDRISLKLRAEKPNPEFDPTKPESDSNRRYLQITDENLRQRGLSDQFYKDYSFFIRNARIWKGTVHMTLAQLLTIDDTVRASIGDVTGFIKEMEYRIDMQTGLSDVTMQVMYI